MQDAQGHTTRYEYDAAGNRTAVVDSLQNRTAFRYDPRNRLLGITYPDASATSFAYDSRGRRTSATDQNGKITTYAYDGADRMTAVTDAAQHTTHYAYDAESNLLSITDAAGHSTAFAYDTKRQVTQTTFPSNLTESYVYDAIGNLTSKTDRKGQTINYVYDALNRLSHKGYPDSTGVDYLYDLVGKIQRVNDSTGIYGFAYDNMGRLVGTSTAYGFLPGQTFANSYAYDAASNRKTLGGADGSTTAYSYDSLSRLTDLTNSWAGHFGFSYDELSRSTQMTRPNGVNTAYQYDSLSRLLSVLHQANGATIDGASYVVDAAGNRTAKTDLQANVTSTYGYDDVYQLLQATQGATTTESYSYDLIGNRLSSLGMSPNNYNASNQLISTPSATYIYDNNGNTLSKIDAGGTTGYAWDVENRLTSVTLANGGTVAFKYDSFGHRIQKSSEAGTTNYLYDGANIITELDVSGNTAAKYAQGIGIDEPLAMSRGGVTSFYQADGLGSITSLSNVSGTVTAIYNYNEFGRVVASTGSTINPFRYTSRESDAETGLYYYRARYYDSSTGRFISEDPIRFRGGVDFYAYVGNNPTNLADPSGLQHPYENITHNSSKMGPSESQPCDKDKNCRMFIRCATTPNTHGQLHCTVTIQNGNEYTDYDGEPSGSIILSHLTVVQSEPDDEEPQHTFVNSAVTCDCAKREADAINSAGLLYSFPIQNSNTAAAMMAAACGIFPNWPWNVHGTWRDGPLSTKK